MSCQQYGSWFAADHSRMSEIWQDSICADLHGTGLGLFS